MVGGVVQETVKSRVSDNLWNLLTLARIRAIARLSQYETAKNDAITLLPSIFKKEIIQNNAGGEFSVSNYFNKCSYFFLIYGFNQLLFIHRLFLFIYPQSPFLNKKIIISLNSDS